VSEIWSESVNADAQPIVLRADRWVDIVAGEVK